MNSLPRPPRMAVIALDAADPLLIREHASRLPAINRLLDNGWQVPIAHEPGLYTGSVWPSLNLGTGLREHGRYFFRQFDPETYLDKLIEAQDLPGTPYWERASEAGLRVAVIDAPKARLAAQLNGVQVLDWASHDPEGAPRTFPPEECDALTGYGEISERTADCTRMMRQMGAERLRDTLIRRIEAKTDFALSLLSRERWDLFSLVFNDTHCAGHQFWSLHDPRHPAHDAEMAARIGDPLLDIYAAVDRGVDRIVEALGDRPILFFTSHGMGAHYDASAMLDECLQRIEAKIAGDDPKLERDNAGFLWAARALWRSTVPLSWRLKLPGARAMSDLAFAALRASRRCFQVPANDNAGAVRLNIAGRDRKGRLAPGAEAEAFLERLKQELSALRNGATGEPVVASLTQPRPLAEGMDDDLPDLVIRWNREVPIASLTAPSIGTVTPDIHSPRTGDHRDRGLAVLCASGVNPGIGPAANPQDIPATILALLGLDPGEITGRSFAPAELATSR